MLLLIAGLLLLFGCAWLPSCAHAEAGWRGRLPSRLRLILASLPPTLPPQRLNNAKEERIRAQREALEGKGERRRRLLGCRELHKPLAPKTTSFRQLWGVQAAEALHASWHRSATNGCHACRCRCRQRRARSGGLQPVGAHHLYGEGGAWIGWCGGMDESMPSAHAPRALHCLHSSPRCCLPGPRFCLPDRFQPDPPQRQRCVW